MTRLTSLDETVVSSGLFGWLAHATLGERMFILVPIIATVAMLSVAARRTRGPTRIALLPAAMLLTSILAFACFRTRWVVGFALVAPALICSQLPLLPSIGGRIVGWASAVFVVTLVAWQPSLPPSLRRPAGDAEPTVADLNALIYRHFAHWLTTHNPGQKINALAPPEVSDSLVFHGAQGVLMSTAWESYPGQVAASRILSAPESTEAEAVLQSRQITHVILPSWDKVLPMLVREPAEQDKTALYGRLLRWVYPPYLRPIPYHLPAVPGYLDQKLVVFKVVPAQDEALALSRLAEYFVEMNRTEPATLAAKVLAQSFADDPNAAIAQATVYAYANDQAGFERELTRLTAEAARQDAQLPWDRRVQRAIVFALGKRHELERAEIKACVADASSDQLFELTPLQAFRLWTLARANDVAFSTPALDQLGKSLGAEYAAGKSSAAQK